MAVRTGSLDQLLCGRCAQWKLPWHPTYAVPYRDSPALELEGSCGALFPAAARLPVASYDSCPAVSAAPLHWRHRSSRCCETSHISFRNFNCLPFISSYHPLELERTSSGHPQRTHPARGAVWVQVEANVHVSRCVCGTSPAQRSPDLSTMVPTYVNRGVRESHVPADHWEGMPKWRNAGGYRQRRRGVCVAGPARSLAGALNTNADACPNKVQRSASDSSLLGAPGGIHGPRRQRPYRGLLPLATTRSDCAGWWRRNTIAATYAPAT